MLSNTQGVILRTVKYSETSLICDAYTAAYGLRTYIINGVRKARAKVGTSVVRPMSLVDMVVYHHPDKEINRIKEIKPFYTYKRLPFEIMRGSIGLFITEVAQKTIKEEGENQALFDFLVETYQVLDIIDDKMANVHLYFMVKLTQYMGFMPNNQASKDDFFDYKEGCFVAEKPNHRYYFEEASSRLLQQLLDADWDSITAILINGKLRHTFIDNMLLYYRYHVGNFSDVNSHIILREILT